MRVLQIVLLVGLAYACLVGMAWLFQRRLIYLPMGRHVPPAAQVLPGAREVILSTDDGLDLSAWLVPARQSDNGSRGGVVVFNGNAGSRADRAPLGDALSGAGFDVLLMDYRGYGGNPGIPSEAGLIRDGRAAATYLRQHLGGESPLVYFGESLGAAVAVAVAVEAPPDTLVLRSPFLSMVAVGKLHYPFLPVDLLLKDRYPSLKRVRSVTCPLLVLAGDRDQIVPAEQSRSLHDAAASNRKRFVLFPRADHNDPVFYSGSRLIREVAAFVFQEDRAGQGRLGD